ncbi:MAG: exodeoxyribonuclease VII small subunit [Coriobacteriia bacterium]|nr:exodeoxyribonuclease VII small subunit [Coriobacteriia bacterium]
MSDSTNASPQDLTFGEAIAELDQVVAALEGGTLELEESLARYERGVALLRALQAKLADAQQKVTMLVGELEDEKPEDSSAADSAAGAASDGEVTEIPF